MDNYLHRRAVLMNNRRIDLVIDVGANEGQFAISLRRQLGYRGRIISFEPLQHAYNILQQVASQDNKWKCHNLALAEFNGNATINVSANSVSSSLLPVSNRAVAIEPSISYIAKQSVIVKKLDDLLSEIAQPSDSIYLKIDTQGYERKIIEGALKVIHRFSLIQLETSFFPIYENETLVGDMIKLLDDLDFCVVSVEPGWQNSRTGELLQADLIFGRK